MTFPFPFRPAHSLGMSEAAFVALGPQFLFNPRDRTSMFTTNTGDIQVVADGDPVGLMLDKSQMGGKTAAQYMTDNGIADPLACPGNHAMQASAAKQPLFRTDGTWHWLQGDGFDDCLLVSGASLAGKQQAALLMAIRVQSAGGAEIVYEYGPDTNANAGSFYGLALHDSINDMLSAAFRGDGTGAYGDFTTASYGQNTDLIVRTAIDLAKVTAIDRLRLNIDGADATASHSGAAPGQGGLGDYDHYLLSRGGAALFSTARVYAAALFDRALAPAEAAQAEGLFSRQSPVILP